MIKFNRCRSSSVIFRLMSIRTNDFSMVDLSFYSIDHFCVDRLELIRLFVLTLYSTNDQRRRFDISHEDCLDDVHRLRTIIVCLLSDKDT